MIYWASKTPGRSGLCKKLDFIYSSTSYMYKRLPKIPHKVANYLMRGLKYSNLIEMKKFDIVDKWSLKRGFHLQGMFHKKV